MEDYLNKMEHELRGLLSTAIKEELDDERSLKSIEGQIKIIESGKDLENEFANLDRLVVTMDISEEEIEVEKNNLRTQKEKELVDLNERKKELANSWKNKIRKAKIFTKIQEYRNVILSQSRELELQTNAAIKGLEQEKNVKLLELQELIEQTEKILEDEKQKLSSKGSTNVLERRLEKLKKEKDTISDEFEQKIADLKARKEQYNSIMRNAANLLEDQSVFEKMKVSEISRLLFKQDRILDKEDKDDKDDLTMAFTNATGLNIEKAEKLLSLIDDQQRKWIEERYQEFKDMGYQKMEMDLLFADFKDYYENDIPSEIKQQIIKLEPQSQQQPKQQPKQQPQPQQKPQPKQQPVIKVDLLELYNTYKEFIVETLIAEPGRNEEEVEEFLDPKKGNHWEAITKMLADSPNIDDETIKALKVRISEYYKINIRRQVVNNNEDLGKYFNENRAKINIAFRLATQISSKDVKEILDSANEEQCLAIAQMYKNRQEGKISNKTMLANMKEYYLKNLNKDKSDEIVDQPRDIVEIFNSNRDSIIGLLMSSAGIEREEAESFLNPEIGEHWKEITRLYDESRRSDVLAFTNQQEIKKYYDTNRIVKQTNVLDEEELGEGIQTEEKSLSKEKLMRIFDNYYSTIGVYMGVISHLERLGVDYDKCFVINTDFMNSLEEKHKLELADICKSVKVYTEVQNFDKKLKEYFNDNLKESLTKYSNKLKEAAKESPVEEPPVEEPPVEEPPVEEPLVEEVVFDLFADTVESMKLTVEDILKDQEFIQFVMTTTEASKEKVEEWIKGNTANAGEMLKEYKSLLENDNDIPIHFRDEINSCFFIDYWKNERNDIKKKLMEITGKKENEIDRFIDKYIRYNDENMVKLGKAILKSDVEGIIGFYADNNALEYAKYRLNLNDMEAKIVEESLEHLEKIKALYKKRLKTMGNKDEFDEYDTELLNYYQENINVPCEVIVDRDSVDYIYVKDILEFERENKDFIRETLESFLTVYPEVKEYDENVVIALLYDDSSYQVNTGKRQISPSCQKKLHNYFKLLKNPSMENKSKFVVEYDFKGMTPLRALFNREGWSLETIRRMREFVHRNPETCTVKNEKNGWFVNVQWLIADKFGKKETKQIIAPQENRNAINSKEVTTSGRREELMHELTKWKDEQKDYTITPEVEEHKNSENDTRFHVDSEQEV